MAEQLALVELVGSHTDIFWPALSGSSISLMIPSIYKKQDLKSLKSNFKSLAATAAVITLQI